MDVESGLTRESLREDRWLSLLVMTRVLGAVAAVALLLGHRVTDQDPLLIAITIGWSSATLAAFARSPRLRASPVAWTADLLAALGLVIASGDWRSPFYIYVITTLVLPATTLGFRGAVAWGAALSTGYGAAALLTRQLPADTIGNTIRLETLATHLLAPIVISLALAYASSLLERLRSEQARSERLAVQAERQRIAWELHDSAKQRVHAAHLLLSALDGQLRDGSADVLEQAMVELRAATGDMETSIAELRAPVDGRPVDELLRDRAEALARAGRPDIEVTGRLPPLPPMVAAHTYRIAVEALVNAVRHASCSRAEIRLGEQDGAALIEVADDGVGLPDPSQRTGHGLRSMRGRAESIDASLDITDREGGGTSVRLLVPLSKNGGRA